MPFLQSSGAISFANLNGFFPGSGTSMSNFYRGGGRVPSTKSVTTRDPASDWYNGYGSANSWRIASPNQLFLVWGNAFQVQAVANQTNTTSYTVGGFTYLRGPLRLDNTGYGGDGTLYYDIARQSTSTVSINTGIPSSGQISLSQFYGAETP